MVKLIIRPIYVSKSAPLRLLLLLWRLGPPLFLSKTLNHFRDEFVQYTYIGQHVFKLWNFTRLWSIPKLFCWSKRNKTSCGGPRTFLCSKRNTSVFRVVFTNKLDFYYYYFFAENHFTFTILLFSFSLQSTWRFGSTLSLFLDCTKHHILLKINGPWNWFSLCLLENSRV